MGGFEIQLIGESGGRNESESGGPKILAENGVEVVDVRVVP